MTARPSVDLVHRLEKLERSNRRLRHGFASIGLLTLVAACLAAPTLRSGTLRAEAFELVDGRGRVVAKWATEGGSAGLVFLSDEGVPKLRLGTSAVRTVHGETAFRVALDESGSVASETTFTPTREELGQWAGLTVMDALGEQAVTLGIQSGSEWGNDAQLWLEAKGAALRMGVYEGQGLAVYGEAGVSDDERYSNLNLLLGPEVAGLSLSNSDEQTATLSATSQESALRLYHGQETARPSEARFEAKPEGVHLEIDEPETKRRLHPE